MDPWEEFVGHLVGDKNRAQGTIDAYEFRLSRLARFTGKDFTHDISLRVTQDEAKAWLRANRHLAPETRRGTIVAAKAWERFGDYQGWWSANGILSIEVPVPDDGPGPRLAPWQVRMLLAAPTNARQWRLVGLGLYAGPRVSDIETMDEDCWLEDRLSFRVQKTGRMLEIPLHPELARLKDVILAEQDINPHGCKYQYQLLRKKVGFHFTPHTLRRTFGQKLLDNGTAFEVVDYLLGHVPRTTTLRDYVTVPWALPVEAINRLDYGS